MVSGRRVGTWRNGRRIWEANDLRKITKIGDEEQASATGRENERIERKKKKESERKEEKGSEGGVGRRTRWFCANHDTG